ncbi:hypothetical protein [Streptomyces aureus]|uniref:Uncharacterized protein n=1 Tax=Streptomyces aureus TaxID=193461 RepID=A0ABV4SD89_9ACTN
MNVLVGDATAHSSTRASSHNAWQPGSSRAAWTRARPMDEVADAEASEAFALGSAIHRQAWLESAKDFVRLNSDTLRFRPVWMCPLRPPSG